MSEMTLSEVLMSNEPFSLVGYEKVEGAVVASFVGSGVLSTFRLTNEVIVGLQEQLAKIGFPPDGSGDTPRQTETYRV